MNRSYLCIYKGKVVDDDFVLWGQDDDTEYDYIEYCMSLDDKPQNIRNSKKAHKTPTLTPREVVKSIAAKDCNNLGAWCLRTIAKYDNLSRAYLKMQDAYVLTV